MNNIEIKRDIDEIAQEINVIKEQTNSYLLQSSIEIGRRIKEAKELVGHGNWAKWLEEKVSYSQRTASNLMKIHEEYGEIMSKNSNSQALANLGYTQAIAMLKLDFEERETFVIENNIEDMTTRELEEAVKEKAELLKEKELLQKQLDWQTEKESEMAIELKDKIERIEEFERLIKEKTEEANNLKERIESESEAVSQEEIEQLKDIAAKREEEIKLLKKKLKEKPTEVEVEKFVDKVPDSVQEELENLRVTLDKANSKLNSSENIAKFKSTFNLLISIFNELVATLGVIETEDPEEYEKYKGAINKLLEKLMINE